MQPKGLLIKARKNEINTLSSRIVCDYQAEAARKIDSQFLFIITLENSATIASMEEAEAVAGRLVAASRRDMNRAGATAHHVR